MRLYDIYQNKINRDINGVVQVDQNDSKYIEQELVEYVVTKELRKHFTYFLNNYEKSFDAPTDKIGVWISGFFGSGKSHFLKMLSYILSNKEISGKSAISYFEDKFDDPMMYAQLEHCVSVPTDTILFNIDRKGSINKDATAILKVFAKVFYDHMGFYGNDLKIAKLEQHITKLGKMDEFKAKYEERLFSTWEESRDSFAFYEDDIVDLLQEVLGMSEVAARNWFNGEETSDFSIEQLVSEIKAYIDSKGKDYRLLFMVDEVGQYIGSDVSLMLNLQTIVEAIGSECGGRVWVMVTSQEAIDTITKISGDDFSKIQGRFNTRISLSSSSVDEVIKKRILGKTENASSLLKLVYANKNAEFKNLISFQQGTAKQDMKGYESEFEFVDVYPFVPYQFRLVQNVLAQVRRHGNAGGSQSQGERSMLSAFQEAAIATMDLDENSLVPFSLFYNTFNTFLESFIRRVIDRCQTAADNKDGIEQYDVEILKVLYLVRYIEDIKSNVENVTTLMVDNVNTNKLEMRKKVQESLDRLVAENYVARNGDTYTFLTDDEQDVAREIRQTIVNGADITQKIIETVYGDLYTDKKFKYDKYDFPIDKLIDETCAGTLTGAMKLRIVTDASELASAGDFKLKSKSTDNEVILLLSNEYPYFEEIEGAKKIRNYVKSRNVAQLPEAIQSIIRARQQQATNYEKNAKELLSKAIINSTVYIAGDKRTDISGSTVTEKINNALEYLVDCVYTKLTMVHKNYDSDSELLQIISNANQASLDGYVNPNAEAIDEIKIYLDLQDSHHLSVNMGDIQRRFAGIPYGWKEIDIAALVIDMVAQQMVTVNYSGSNIQPSDRKLPDYLRRKTEIDKTIIKQRISVPKSLIDLSRTFLKQYFNDMDVPTTEDNLVTYIVSHFEQQRKDLNELVSTEYSSCEYPQKDVVVDGISLIDKLLIEKKDNLALFNAIKTLQDDLLDFNDDMSDIMAFFKSQKNIFDNGRRTVSKYSGEKDYLQSEREITESLEAIRSIIAMPKPYRRISEIPTLIQTIENAYGVLLSDKRIEVSAEIDSAIEEIKQTAKFGQEDVVTEASNVLGQRKSNANSTNTLTALDAMKIQIQNIKQQYLKRLVIVDTPATEKSKTVNRSTVVKAGTIKNASDVDAYVESIKKSLLEMLDDNDVIHII